MYQNENERPLISPNLTHTNNISQYKLYQHHIVKLNLIGALALISGILYWDTNKEPGLRYQGLLTNSTLAPLAPIFPVSAQLGGSLTNVFFNYVAFLDLSKQFQEPITQSYSKNCNSFNWAVHWLAALLLGFFTTLPQWSIGLDGTLHNDVPETVSSLLDCFVNIQGASCLLKAIWNLPLNHNQTQSRNKEIQANQSANLSQGQTEGRVTSSNHVERIQEMGLSTVESQNQLTCAKKVGINTVTGILGLLGLWMNVGICMKAYTATDTFLNKIGLPSPESIKLTSVAFNISCSLGYFLRSIKSLMSTLKLFCSPSSRSEENDTISILFAGSAALIACFSLFSGFTVDQMTYDSFETLPTQWRFALSFCANLGALFYNMFQSIRLPSELVKAIRHEQTTNRQPKRRPLPPDAESGFSDSVTCGS